MCITIFFFFNDTATTEIYTLSLHDALPISQSQALPSPTASPKGVGCADFGYCLLPWCDGRCVQGPGTYSPRHSDPDRKSTRLNSSHANISYAVFCLKKKNTHDFRRVSKFSR